MTRRMNAKKISKSILALLITVPALLATNAMAQELKKPTLEDLIPGGETYHKPENKSYQWWGDAACLELGIDNIEGTWAVKGLGAKPGEKFTAITLEEANALLEEKGLQTASLSCCKGCQRTPRRQSGIEVQIDPLLLLNTGKYRALVDWKKKKSSGASLAPPKPQMRIRTR